MTKKNNLTEVPYKWVTYYYDDDKTTSHWELQQYVFPRHNVEWRPNDPFEAELHLDDFARGRSAATFWWNDPVSNTRYPMFMSGMVELLKTHTVVNGVVTATWRAVKRGSNYGIEAVA